MIGVLLMLQLRLVAQSFYNDINVTKCDKFVIAKIILLNLDFLRIVHKNKSHLLIKNDIMTLLYMYVNVYHNI